MPPPARAREAVPSRRDVRAARNGRITVFGRFDRIGEHRTVSPQYWLQASINLGTIFERELVRTVGEQSTPVVYGKIVHAHGLLSNCFQQATITLLHSFEPTMDGATLFNDAELRLRQSLVLCRELSSLLRFVRRAETQTDPDILRKVVGKILEFRDGSMQYLMYKDWRGYENLALEVVTAIENNGEAQPLLHQLACFLEILYGHVKMRTVLADIFPYSGDGED